MAAEAKTVGAVAVDGPRTLEDEAIYLRLRIGMLDPHPPTEERIARLADIKGQLARSTLR